MENGRHAGYVRCIGETAKHALAVVEALLPSAAGVSPWQSCSDGFDVAALAGDVVAGMSLLAARAGVHLVGDTNAIDARTSAQVCPTDVRQMLINLVSNGIVHAGGGSTVRVSTERGDGLVSICVADNGPGISQEIIECLEAGAPLESVSAVTAGSRLRLGLTLTRALAVANGGRLEISSGAGGTEVRIILPAFVQALGCE
jgi:signal transduction histidine kinase